MGPVLTITLGVAGGIILAVAVLSFVVGLRSGAIRSEDIVHGVFRWTITLMLLAFCALLLWHPDTRGDWWVILPTLLGTYLLHGCLKRVKLRL